MPTYEYVCDACGHSFERMQRFSEEPIKECPHCKQLKVRRVIHPTGIIFKGSGWYITDHGRGGGRRSSGASSNGGEKETKKDEPASTKPESGGKTAVDTDD